MSTLITATITLPAPRLCRRRHVWLRRAFLALALVVAVLLGAAGLWYYRVTHHVTPQELSHAVNRTAFPATLRGQPVQLPVYQQGNAQNQRVVLFTSGDGGWSPFCANIAARLADDGFTVVGFDAKDYMTRFATSDKPLKPEEIARDYGELLTQLRGVPNVDADAPATLSGWSLGAGFSVVAAALSPVVKSRADRLLAISLPVQNELAWKVADSLIYLTEGVPREKVFDAGDYLPKIAPLKFQLIYATDDQLSPATDAQALFAKAVGTKQLLPVTARDHHYQGGEEQFYQTLEQSLRGPL